ncbi:MAG: hypothetical protein IKW70_04745 [Verrucomicrobia bacterium]|nr:hypothetical protein [Verrucomicrobiota bacterium]
MRRAFLNHPVCWIVWVLMCLDVKLFALAPEDVEGLRETFNLSAEVWTVQQTACSLGENVLRPGQKAEFTFFVKPDQDFKGRVRLETVRYGMRPRLEEPRRPSVYRIETVGIAEQEAEISTEGGFLTFAPEVGERLGGYALVMELEGRGRVLAAVLVRIAAESNIRRSVCPFIQPEDYLTEEHPQVQGKEYDVVQVWALGAAAVSLRSAGTLELRDRLLRNGLPWITVWEDTGVSRRSEDSQIVMVLGDLRGIYEPDRTLFRSVPLNAGASFAVEDPLGEFETYDFYGNPLETVAGRIILPLGSRAYWLKTGGRKGSFKRLRKAIEQADIRNVGPVELTPLDFTDSVTNVNTTLKLRVSNVLNRPLKGTLQALVPGLVLEEDILEVKLKPYQSKVLEYKIMQNLSQERDGNNYPIVAAWSSEGETTLKHAEILHVNRVARLTPVLDGNLEEWKNQRPVSAFVPVEPHPAEKRYQPFGDWPIVLERQTVTAYTAWDEDGFYFAAQLPVMPTEGDNIELSFNEFPENKKTSAAAGYSAEETLLFAPEPETDIVISSKEDRAEWVVKRNVYECRVPWSQIPRIHALILKGKPIRFNYRVSAGGRVWELACGRSVSRLRSRGGGPLRWSNELLFGVEK